MQITTIGLDLSKSIFQIHGVGEDGALVLMKRLRRKQMEPFFAKLPACLIGIEACATAHHWARVLVGLGHAGKQGMGDGVGSDVDKFTLGQLD